MSSGSIRLARNGNEALKQLRPQPRLDAPALALLSRQLGDQGVPTPRCEAVSTDQLRYAWVEGISARECYAAEIAAGQPDWPDLQLLTRLLRPLVRLHQAAVEPLPPPLDPGWRVVPRLEALADPELERCWHRLRARWPGSGCPVVLHGDFHIGQLLLQQPVPAVDTSAANLQVVDLEDCASGPAEFDLGNFAAHLVTAADRFDELRYPQLLERITLAYQHSGGEPADPQRLLTSATISLLRRYLKRREQHRDWRSPSLRQTILSLVQSD